MKIFNLVEVIEDDLKKLGNAFCTSRRNKFNRDVFFYYNKPTYFTLTLLFYLSFIVLPILCFFDFSTLISLTTGFIISYFFYRLVTIYEEKENLKNALYFLKESLSLFKKMKEIDGESIKKIKFELDSLVAYYTYKVNNNDYMFIKFFLKLKEIQKLIRDSIDDIDSPLSDFNPNSNFGKNMRSIKIIIPKTEGFLSELNYSFYADGEELEQKIKEMQEEDEKNKAEEYKYYEEQRKLYEE